MYVAIAVIRLRDAHIVNESLGWQMRRYNLFPKTEIMIQSWLTIFQNGSLGLRTKQKRKKVNVENVLLLCGGARI